MLPLEGYSTLFSANTKEALLVSSIVPICQIWTRLGELHPSPPIPWLPERLPEEAMRNSQDDEMREPTVEKSHCSKTHLWKRSAEFHLKKNGCMDLLFHGLNLPSISEDEIKVFSFIKMTSAGGTETKACNNITKCFLMCVFH